MSYFGSLLSKDIHMQSHRINLLDPNMEVIHFPKYAPEENPQEHVWKRGRSETTHNRFIDDIDTATDDLVTFLNTTTFPYTLLGMSPVS